MVAQRRDVAPLGAIDLRRPPPFVVRTTSRLEICESLTTCKKPDVIPSLSVNSVCRLFMKMYRHEGVGEQRLAATAAGKAAGRGLERPGQAPAWYEQLIKGGGKVSYCRLQLVIYT